ncbi:hypothetical protein RND71_023256 [Anisodus tanguticus]|uniref:Uncharacterized protein n=1 Tax=Anisodus tanguticus TaxID=243964 RepID=A0AAE1RTJ8_9SOLA|nr:hypothetical protein RND71_023256 [Anisodus tanguticus]
MSAHHSPTLDDFLTIQGSAKASMAPSVVAIEEAFVDEEPSLVKKKKDEPSVPNVSMTIPQNRVARNDKVKGYGVFSAEYTPNSFSTQGCPQMRSVLAWLA